MSRNASMWRALGHLSEAEGVQAATDAGDLSGARAIVDDVTGLRLLSEALPSWRWLGERAAFG
jgi:hypothetical protein